jgi:hypothetical protein
MSTLLDVTADQPPATNLLAVRAMTSEEVARLSEELVAYHQHFAPLFYRREQREWAAVYLRGLLTADVPRKNVEAMALPSSPPKVTVEVLAQQWPSCAWQRFRLLEGPKGPLVADFLVLRAVLPRDRLPGPEIWVVIRRKVSGEASEPEWKF